MNKTILPPNRTPFEVAMEAAIKEGQNISDLVIRNLWNPDTCPIDVLPWLAWALSVDKWDMDWTEEVKRNVVRSSVEVHRKKGTVHAIRQAVRAVYSDTEINEWFNYGGNPYHFKIADTPKVGAVSRSGHKILIRPKIPTLVEFTGGSKIASHQYLTQIISVYPGA